MPLLQHLKVMVVDHDPQSRIALVDCLNAIGIPSVRAAGDGEQAFAALVASPCDAVFTTLQLPRLTGPQLLQALRGQGATRMCRVILVGARNDAAPGREGEAHGFDADLSRPFTPATVKAVLEAVLGRLS